MYGVSFTRDKNFHKNSNQGGSRDNIVTMCRLTIDGNLLSNRYKFQPHAQEGFEKNSPRYFESEERIISDKEFSIPIVKYIINVNFIEDIENYHVEYEVEEKIKELILICKKKNIKIGLIDSNGNPTPLKVQRNFFQKLFNL